MMSSGPKQILKSLCCSHGWSYAVSWRFDQRNPMLLAFEDSYHDEQIRTVVDDMLLQVHIFGEGIIGEAALTGNHRWLFSDTVQDVFQDEHEFNGQFVSGVQTLLVVPVGSRGVVQFGSTQKILESSELLDQTVRTLQEMHTFDGVSTNSHSSLDPEMLGLDGLLDLGNSAIDPIHGYSFDEIMMGNLSSSTSPALQVASEIYEPSEITRDTEQSFPQEQQSHDTGFVPGDCDFGTDILNLYSLDDLYQLLSDSPDQNADSEGLNACSVSPSALLEDCLLASCSDYHQERSAVMQGSEKDLFDVLGLNFGSQKLMDCREDASFSAMSGVSQIKPEIDGTSLACQRKGLFSELGIDELISNLSNNPSSSVTNPTCFEDHLSPKKRRRLLDSSSASSSFIAQRNLSCFSGGNMNLMPSDEKDAFTKSHSGLWIDDSFSFNVAGTSNLKKPEEPVKVTKKKAKPGESTRPRPKDRQMIQDRIKELRGIIPNGAKCSIDALLDLTIKHMLFMQSVAKYADKLKQPYKPKLINQSGSCTRERVGDSNGATWAFEVGDKSVVCPIIVEDLNPAGQMLIEMLCEERGQFLEIADVIKGFGLNILKGVMEAQEGKIWAHFIVEAKRHVTRLDVFWSLVQLLQQQDNTTNDSVSQTASVTNRGTSVSEPSNSISRPVSFVESLQ